MRVPINLASQPYENLRPLYLAAGGSVVLLALLALLLAWNVRQNRNETRVLTEQSERYRQDLANLRREQQELTQWLARLEVQDIRDRSAFLNSLIVRKSLSWTQMFMDLERVLPQQVQVTAIRPSANQSSEAQLNLTVSAGTVPPLVDFLKNLEGAAEFGSPAVDSQRFPVERATDPSIILELSVLYHQNAERPAAPSKEIEDPEGETNGDMAAAAEKQFEKEREREVAMRLPAFLKRGNNGGSSARKRIRIVVAVLLALNGILLFFIIRRPGLSPEDRQEEAEGRRAEYESTLATVKQMRDLKTKLQGAIQNDDRFSQEHFLHRQTAFSAMLTDLERIASRNQLKTASISYQLKENTKQPGFVNVAVAMAVEGQYEDLIHFINTLEQSQLFWIIGNLNVSVSQARGLRLNLQLETYAVT